MLTTRECIACVVVMDDFFQALKVAVVHIGLDEIGTRPPVHIPQGRYLELAVELRSEPRPIGIRVELRIPEEVACPFVYIRWACWVGGVSVSVRLIKVEKWNRWIPGDAEIGRGEVGKQRRLASGISGGDLAGWLAGQALGSIQVASVALRLAAKQVPSCQFVCAQDTLVGIGEGGIEFRREGADLRRGFKSRNGERELVISRV